MNKDKKQSKIYQVPEQEFIEIIKNSKHRGEALYAIGCRRHDGKLTELLQERCRELNLDTSHWRVGTTRRNAENTLCKDTNATHSKIRNLFKNGNYKEYECEFCGKEEKSLQLNYINGDKTDARIENLRWLCHSCFENNLFATRKTTRDVNSILAYKMSDRDFSAIIAQANSKQEAARLIGYKSPHDNAFKYIFQRCEELGIDTSHWSHCAWRGCEPRTYDNTFCKDSTACQDTLRTKFKHGNYKEYKCAMCGNTGTWNGKPLVLRLDHTDGDRTNATVENLRWLCPNCDKLTDTFCGRNSRRMKRKTASTGGIAEITSSSQEKPKTKSCPGCGELITDNAKYCAKCAHEMTRRAERPSKEKLLKQLENQPFTSVAKEYGVSDNSIRKWLKWYGLSKDEIKEIARKSRENRKRETHEQ